MRKSQFIFALMISRAFLSFEVSAQSITGEDCGDDCAWSLEGGILTVTGSGKIQNFTEGANGDYTTDAPWFEYQENIEKIVIQNKSDTEKFDTIVNNAFEYMSAVKEVVLPDSIETIGYASFHFSPLLETINLPSNLKNLGAWAISYTNISSVELPEGLETLGDVALNRNMTSVYLPSSLFEGETPGISKYALSRSHITTIYCAEDDQKCASYQAFECNGFDGTGCVYPAGRKPIQVKTYQKEAGGKYVSDGVRYSSFADMQKGENGVALKRIYTIDEANQVAGKVNSVKIRYR